MDGINTVLAIVLLITTLIDVVPMLYDSRLSDYQKYAYIPYGIATVCQFLEGDGGGTFFWGLSTVISFLYGDGTHEGLYLGLFGMLSVLWGLYVVLFSTTRPGAY